MKRVNLVFIIEDESSYYTLQGVKVNKPTSKGVYLHNGKKIVVK